jgi:hypothetical protein
LRQGQIKVRRATPLQGGGGLPEPMISNRSIITLIADRGAMAVSSEIFSGSRKENASKHEIREFVFRFK